MEAAGLDRTFLAREAIDCTLRFICLATLLLGPDLPGTVVLDEPELGLHPAAIGVLAEMARVAGRSGHRVILATQSVPLVSHFNLREIIILDRTEGATQASRPDEEFLGAFLEDYSTGSWRHYDTRLHDEVSRLPFPAPRRPPRDRGARPGRHRRRVGEGLIPARGLTRLRREIARAGGPERIDHGPSTAPSKRLLRADPGYLKTVTGPLLVAEAGLSAVLARCPTFAAWWEDLLS
ncbi:DUF4276 family protein [Actinomyces sp. oral taxon 448]|uniref:DUF4276 family protein n=1 Tax=Actinomyces sp. oral taxon 448 TaxID=712124 RepID=UPI0034507B4A